MQHSTTSPAIWRALLLAATVALAGPALADAESHHRQRPSKLSDEVRQRGKGKGPGTVDVIVRFHNQPGAREDAVVAKFEGKVRRRHRSRWMSVRVPANRVEKLAEDPNVEFVALDAELALAALDPSREAAGLPDSYQPESLLKGAGVTIAQIDSGVAQRPELAALVASVDFVGTYDPSFAAGTSVDPHGHGTHVAGILVGNGSHSADGKLVGIAPEASLVSVRVLEQRRPGHELEPAGRPAVGARPQGPVRDPRPQPVARTSGLRAARRRSAGAGGGRALGCGHRGRVLGRQRRPARPRHDQQPLQLAQGHHGGGPQRPQDRGLHGRHRRDLLRARADAVRSRLQARPPRAGEQDLVDALSGVHARRPVPAEPDRR